MLVFYEKKRSPVGASGIIKVLGLGCAETRGLVWGLGVDLPVSGERCPNL